jgi:hypothetical protein
MEDSVTLLELTAKFGVHEFAPGVKPEGASQGSHYPCRVCGASRKHSIHRKKDRPEPQAVADADTVCVKCPTCDGKGTVLLKIADVQKLALRGGK